MFRRVVCLLLVPALFINQAAVLCCAHSHHESMAEGHSARTHVHISGQSHKMGSHDHVHSDRNEHVHVKTSSDDSELDLDGVLRWPLEHDSDAVFMSEPENVHLRTSRITFAVHLFVLAYELANFKRADAQDFQCQLSGVPYLRYDCAIYLQILCLRI